jgi:hypothetical protein
MRMTTGTGVTGTGVTRMATEPGHFPGCHPEHAEDPRKAPAGEIQDTEPCWHCGTPTSRGCNCQECCKQAIHIAPSAVYHCATCGRWWAWMTGLNITEITSGAQPEEPTP